MPDLAFPRSSPRAVRSRRRRTALVVVLSLLAGLVGATGAVPARQAAAAVSATLLSSWKFDAGSGTTAVDSTGTRPATLLSGAAWTTSAIRGPAALSFSGVNTSNAYTASAVLTTTGSFSVTAYVKPASLTGTQTYLSQDGSNVSAFNLQLRSDTGRFAFSRRASDSTSAAVTSAGATAAPVVGQWYHLAGVYDASAATLALYVNGRLQDTVAAPTAWASNGSFAFGRGKSNATTAEPANATVDDARAYRGALSESDVEQIADAAWYPMDEGSGTTAADAGLNGSNATLTNGASWVPQAVGSSAVGLDGSDDQVVAGSSLVDTAKSFSVTTWARADVTNAVGVVASVDGTTRSAFTLQMGSDGRWVLTRPASDATAATVTTAAATAAAVRGSWYHLGVVYDSVAKTLALYVDGVLQGSAVSYTTGWKGTGNFVLGRGRSASAPASYLSGAVDEVHVYPFVLEVAMVKDLAAPPVPAAPATPAATTSGSQATVTWVAPAPVAASPTTSYVVTPYLNGTAQAARTFGSTATTQSITGLTLGGSYRFTVAAVNGAGTSAPSPQSSAVVPAAVPGTPAAPTATPGSESATVSWTAPSSNGSAITGYVVTPYVGSTAQQARTFASTTTTQTLNGLTAGTAYTFRVAAVNAVGTGTASPASAAVTPNANPGIVVATPPDGRVGAAYSFQLTRTGGTSPFVWSVSSGALPAGVSLGSSTGLLSGTPTTPGRSTVTIKLVDAGGASDTETVTLVVADKPATPAAPSVSPGLGSAVVSWVAPADNSSTITAYVITPYLNGTAQAARTVDPSAKTRTFPGLTVGGSYTFTIAATNAIGTSTASGASNAVTPYAGLGRPTITSVTAGTTSARLSWTAPTDTGGSPVTGYVVTPYLGTTAQTPQTFTGTATTQTVTGLSAGQSYTFTVAALNSSGTSVLYRIDAGGPGVPATDGGPAWSADNTDASPYRSSDGSGTADYGTVVGQVDWTVPSYAPIAMFNTERWIPDPGTLRWAFPVPVGTKTLVRVYIANGWDQTAYPGSRLFDVALDGTVVLPSFDPVVAAGGSYTGTMREFATTSDGTVNLDFAAVLDYPFVDGIEILQTGTATTGPPSNASVATTPNAAPTLTFAAPPAATVGTAYSRQLTLSGGTSPYSWSVGAGSLPAGLTLNPSTGLLSGTPTTSGSYPSTITVTDASGQSASQNVTLVVAAAPVITFAPGPGEVGVAYSRQPGVSGGVAPLTWSVAGGSLPAGVSISTTTGLVSGTPAASGTFTIILRVVDANGSVANRNASVVIAAAPTLSGQPPAGRFGVDYAYTFVAAGGTGPFTYSVVSGTLPTGVTLSSAGVLSGRPRQLGTVGFTVRVVDTYGQSADDVVSVVVAPAPVQVSAAADATSTVAGATITYTVTSKNLTTTAYPGITQTVDLTGVLDDATYGSASASNGAVTRSGSSLTWTLDQAGGATETLTYTVVVRTPDPGDLVLSSRVSTAGVSGNCYAGSTDPGCVTTTTVSALTIVHTSGSGTTTPGSTVTFTTQVTNSGQTPYADALVTDNLAAPGVLDDATYNRDGRATAGSVTLNGSALAWTGDLAVGASATITYSVTVLDPDPGNRSLSSTVVSPTAGSSCPSSSPAASCTTAVTVLVPALTISVRSPSPTTTPGSMVSFLVSVTNTGQTAYTGITVAVAGAGLLDDATGLTGSATTGTVGVSAGSLVWTGSLAVGASTTITATVTVRDPDPGDKVLTAVASSSAPGSSCPTGGKDPACRSSVQVLVPALTLVSTADSPTTTPGSTATYTVAATNSGQTPYTGASFAVALDGVLDDATYASATASTGTASFSGSTVSWTGDLAVGASATVTFLVVVRDPDPGDQTMTSVVTSSTPGATCPAGSTDARCATRVSVLIPGLAITTVPDVPSTTPGSVVHYRTTVANTGETTYSSAVVRVDFAGSLDDADLGSDGTVTAGSIDVFEGYLLWTLTLAPGQTAEASVSFTVHDPDTGDHSLVSTFTSTAPGSACPTAGAEPGCSLSIPVLVPRLSVTTVADATSVTPGDTVGYTVTVANTGQTTYAPARVAGDLSGVLDDAAYAQDASASTGSVSVTGSALTWSGTLAPGASATIRYSVTVRDPDPGDKRMFSTVVSSDPGSSCAAPGTNPGCSSTVAVAVPGLTLVTTADRATTAPGQEVTFTATVTNSGGTAYPAAAFTDDLGATLDDASYDKDATASSGSVSYASSTLRWTGALAVGASATVTYSVTVTAAPVGDNLLSSSLSSSSRGSSCQAGDANPRCSVTVPVARLVLERHPQETSATPGSLIHIPATYTNTGQVPYTGITILHPRVDSADDVEPVGADHASSGTLSLTADAVVWQGDIAVGQTITVDVVRRVKNPDPGDKIIKGTMSSTAPGNNCPTGTTDPRCSYEISVLVPALTISTAASTAAVAPGGTVTYTVTVANSGQTASPQTVVTVPLTGVLDEARYDGDAAASRGSTSYAGSTLTWTGDLAVGQSAVITYSVTANDPPTGDKLMVVTVVSDNPGSSCPSSSPGPGCSASVVVLTPALTITTTASAAAAALGDQVIYTIGVLNSGQTPYPAASLSLPLGDLLDDAALASAPTATSGQPILTATTLTWTGALAPGAGTTITVRLTVLDPSPGNRSLASTVISSTNGNNCTAGSNDPRCSATVSVVNATAVTYATATDIAYTTLGAKVTHTVRIASATTVPTGSPISFDDALGSTLDDAAYDGDAAATQGTSTYVPGSGLHWQGVTSGSVTVVTYSVTVNAAASGDGVLTSTLTASSGEYGNNCTGSPMDPRCTSSVPVARLVIDQSYTESSVTPGSVAHLVGTFTNAGAYTYRGISIDLMAGDSVDDATPNGDQTASSGSFVVTASSVVWTGDLAPGQTVTVAGSLTVLDPDPGDRLLEATLATDAPGSNCAPTSTDPRCTATLPVRIPGLSITKAVDVSSVAPGGVATYTVTVQNNGETPYLGATVTDSLAGVLDDATLDVGSAHTSSGRLAYSAPDLTWTGDLAVSASAVITYPVRALRPATGDKSMVNTVSSSAEGSSCPPGATVTGCRTTTTVRTPALTTVTSADLTSAGAGDVVTYTVTTTNTGQTDYTGAGFSVPFAGLADDANYNEDARTTTGTPVVTASALSWRGPLTIGSSVTLTFSVTVLPASAGDHLLAVVASSANEGANCAPGSADPRCGSALPVAELHLESTADVATTLPTGVVGYTLTLTNRGRVPYVDTRVDDDLSGAVDDAGYDGDAAASSGSVTFLLDEGRLSWTGDVPVGGTVTITASMTVKNPDPGDRSMPARAISDASGSSCPTAGTDLGCVADVSVLTPGLALSTTADRATATPGQLVAYTVTIANSGQTAYTGLRVSNPLTAVLGDATYQGDVVASGGSVTFSGSTLTWVGDLDPQEAVTITYRVRVNDPDLGDKVLLNRVTSDALGSSCPTGSTAAVCSATTTVLVPALDVAVTADQTVISPGSVVGYTVTVHNVGQTVYQDAGVTLSLAGVLDDAAYAGDATSSSGTVAYGAPTVTWTGDLALDQTVTITYSVRVASSLALGDRVLRTSFGSTEQGSSCTTDAPCSHAVAVQLPGLSVVTSADATTTTPGDRVAFTVTLTNTGQLAYLGATVRTALADVLDDATLSGSARASSGLATISNGTLTWTGTLLIATSVTISYDVVVAQPGSGNRVLSTTTVSDVSGSSCPTGGTSPACTATVAVRVPALTVSTFADVASTTPGAVVTYTVLATNTGETRYDDATVTEALHHLLDDADYNDDAAVMTGGGRVEHTGEGLSWTGDLVVGATVRFTFSMTVHDPNRGDRSLAAIVGSAAAGSSCVVGDTALACSSVVPVLLPGLTVATTTDTDTVVAGDAVRYTVQVTNTGETPYAPATVTDSLSDVLDDGELTGTIAVDTGSVVASGTTVVWTGALDPGQSATIGYTVTTTFPGTGDHRLDHAVSSTSADARCRDGSSPPCHVLTPVLVPALTLSKSADAVTVVAGGRVAYTLVATNTGQADYPAATVTDSLADLAEHVDLEGDAVSTTGDVTVADGLLTWTGPLAVGEAVTITYSVTVKESDPGGEDLVNHVASDARGSSCPPANDNPLCTATTSVAAGTLSLSGLDSGFVVTGQPGGTAELDSAVVGTVTTNSNAGYDLTLQSEWGRLVGAGFDNDDTFDVGNLSVRGEDTDGFVPLSASTAVRVQHSDHATAADGDAVSNDFRVQIPDVREDVYFVPLDYIASAR